MFPAVLEILFFFISKWAKTLSGSVAVCNVLCRRVLSLVPSSLFAHEVCVKNRSRYYYYFFMNWGEVLGTVHLSSSPSFPCYYSLFSHRFPATTLLAKTGKRSYQSGVLLGFCFVLGLCFLSCVCVLWDFVYGFSLFCVVCLFVSVVGFVF